MYAPQVGVGDARCDEVLGIVGLTEAADRRTGGFSMGMRQRLALATTLLGDPQVLLLDEPANGLDPEGIAWLRQFLRYLAAQGRTVLVSSHVLSEVEQTVDDVVIIARGRLVHASSLAQLEAMARPAVRISSPDAAGLAALVAEQGWGPTTRFDSPSTAVVFDRHCPQVGDAAYARGLPLHELAPAGTSLEALFLQLTADPIGPGRCAAGCPDRTRGHDTGGGAMIAALRTELRKVSTTRTWWLTALVMFGYMVVMGVIMAFSLVMGMREAEKAGALRRAAAASGTPCSTRCRSPRRSTRWRWRWATSSRRSSGRSA